MYLQNVRNGDLSSSTIDKLIKRGYLTERSLNDERQYIKKIAEIYHRHASQLPSFMFAPTFSCQMRCIYCYEAHITHREDEISLLTMSSEHVLKAYAAIDNIVESFEKKIPNTIILFGGEPLMAKNYQIVREIVEEGIKRKYNFTAITNGYDLLKYENLLGPGKIENLQITLDGPESVHNKRRFAKNKLPTFNNIVAGIQLALDKGCMIKLRTNVDKSNINYLTELNQFYIEKGWNKFTKFIPYLSVVQDNSRNVLLPMELLTLLHEGYSSDLSDNVIQVDFGIKDNFNSLLTLEKTPILKPYYCASNLGNYIFGPDGNIYTCWDEVGLKDGRIGTYMPELIWNDERSREWVERTIAKIPECLNCPYALICGGGCGHQAKVNNGSLLSPYCHQFPEIFQYLVPFLYEKHIKTLQQE